jgi:S-DNA-T family DNA segregation ATPase FtsK/SpoIIIE
MAEGEDDEAGPLEKDWEKDEYYDDAVKLVIDKDKASISMIQRKFRIGYNRAARIVDRMESEGIVSESDGCTARDVLAEEVPEHIE